ncbi:hypothetical protein ACFW04_009118 [Cataglyphis niger]
MSFFYNRSERWCVVRGCVSKRREKKLNSLERKLDAWLFRILRYAMNSLVEEVVVEAGKNVTLGCPGVTEDSLVLMLEWRANGMRLLEYKSRSTTVVRRTEQNRMSLSLKNYSLQLHPVTAADSGMYECLVNNRNAPEAVIKLIVRGRWRNFLNLLLFSGPFIEIRIAG